MKMKVKSWVWKLTWPFAHMNYTTLGNTLYYPEGYPPSSTSVEHEEVHAKQQKDVGVVWFVIQYLLFFPVLYNPFRYKMEYQAFKQAQGYSDEKIHEILTSRAYGWLKLNRKGKR